MDGYEVPSELMSGTCFFTPDHTATPSTNPAALIPAQLSSSTAPDFTALLSSVQNLDGFPGCGVASPP